MPITHRRAIRTVSPGHLVRQGNPVPGGRLGELEAEGKTVVVLVRDDVPGALFAFADIVSRESREAIAELKALGISSVMLTGDAMGVAASVSRD